MDKRQFMIGLGLLPTLGIHASLAHENKTSDDEKMMQDAYQFIEIKPGFYYVKGEGGNILLSTGSDGSLLIDSGYDRNAQALYTLLSSHDFTPKYLINTHWHGDHTGGNSVLGKESLIVAHENVRSRLSSPQVIEFFNVEMPIQPKEALPVITYEKEMSLAFNGVNFNLTHYAESHTDTDSVIYIPEANIVHTGDLCFAGMFPFIDPGSKGNVRNVIASLKDIVENIDDDTIVVPGHGPISNKKELISYISMLQVSADTVANYQSQTLTLAQMQEKGLPEEIVSIWGAGFINEASWIQLVSETL